MDQLTDSVWMRESVTEYIERNFRHVKGIPYCPILFCRKKTGPGDESLIATAMARKIGDRTINAIKLPTASIACLIPRDTLLASSRCARSGYSAAVAWRPAS